MKKPIVIACCLALVFSFFQLQAPVANAGYEELPAFPGAEGFGYAAKGGRGGEVYHVTSYELTGPGTFYDALTTAGETPRTIVFDISGDLTVPKIVLRNKSNITIAGQTAPGDGVRIRSENIRFYNCRDIVIRYMTFRTAEGGTDDTMYFEDCQNVIIDHSSFSWGGDEVLSIKSKDYENPKSKNITVQWSIISEGRLTHSMGGLIEMNTITMHHNLYAHNNDRNPKTKGQIDFVNNVLYNWGQFPYVAGGESGTKGYGNVVGNYFIAGVNSMDPQYAVVRGNENYQVYLENNRIDSNKNGVVDGVDAGTGIIEAKRPSVVVDERFEYPLVHTESPEDAYRNVMAHAGSSLARDAVDRRVIDSVKAGTGAIIGHEKDPGPYPPLKRSTGPADADLDGMPDEWEQSNGLNPLDPLDRNGDRDGDGYTNLEQYLNELAAPDFPRNYPMTPAPWAGTPFEPPVEPEPAPEPVISPVMDGETVRNVVINDNSGSGAANAANWSVQASLQPGDIVFGDRMTGSKVYKFVTVPDSVKGTEWIRSAMESRSSTSSDLLSFVLAADADVYVAYDTRISSIPSWLSSYDNTGEKIVDDQPVEFRLYKKRYAAGSVVTMGANGNTSRCNYFVIVKPSSPETEPPANGPEALTAGYAADDNAVSLAWPSVSEATYYLVYRSSLFDEGYRAIDSVAASTYSAPEQDFELRYTDTDVVQGVSYRYQVSAVNAGGESPLSDSASVTAYDPALPAPSAPTGLQAPLVRSLSAKLSWTPVEGAVGYQIYRASGATGSYEWIGGSLTAEYTDRTVSPSTSYSYRVSAVGGGGESEPSDGITVTTKNAVSAPQTPFGLAAVQASASGVLLQWNAVSEAETYNIYRKGNADSAYALIGSTDSAAYTDRSISVGESGYSYRVTAVNEMGESAPSGEIAVAVPAPSAPSGLTFGYVGETFVGLIWTTAEGASQYSIYRAKAGESEYELAGTAKVGAYYDRTAAPGTHYTYYVVAQNGGGQSSKSETVKVTTLHKER